MPGTETQGNPKGTPAQLPHPTSPQSTGSTTGSQPLQTQQGATEENPRQSTVQLLGYLNCFVTRNSIPTSPHPKTPNQVTGTQPQMLPDVGSAQAWGPTHNSSFISDSKEAVTTNPSAQVGSLTASSGAIPDYNRTLVTLIITVTLVCCTVPSSSSIKQIWLRFRGPVPCVHRIR